MDYDYDKHFFVIKFFKFLPIVQGIDMDQSDGGMMNEDFQSSLFGASGTINFEGVSSNEQQHFAANKVIALTCVATINLVFRILGH